jgi:hypothetical protein
VTAPKAFGAGGKAITPPLVPIAAANDLRTFAQTLCQGIYLARR